MNLDTLLPYTLLPYGIQQNGKGQWALFNKYYQALGNVRPTRGDQNKHTLTKEIAWARETGNKNFIISYEDKKRSGILYAASSLIYPGVPTEQVLTLLEKALDILKLTIEKMTIHSYGDCIGESVEYEIDFNPLSQYIPLTWLDIKFTEKQLEKLTFRKIKTHGSLKIIFLPEDDTITLEQKSAYTKRMLLLIKILIK